MTFIPPVPLDTCKIAYLLAEGERHRIRPYLAGDRAVIRPIRNATSAQLAIHAALIARRDEVGAYLFATRPHPLTSEEAADAASWRVCRIPHEALVSLAIHELNRWLHAADRGRLRYDPAPPHMQPDAATRPAPTRRARRPMPDDDRMVF